MKTAIGTVSTATEVFLKIKAEIDAAVEKIRAASEEHFGLGPDEINWGHVGDLSHYRELLFRVVAEINQTEE